MKALLLVTNLMLFQIPAAAASFGAARLARGSRDEWRLLAWVPVIPLAAWGLYVAWGVTRDPTSHNLWPFELVFWGLISSVLLGVFLVARRLLGGRDTVVTARRDRSRDT